MRLVALFCALVLVGCSGVTNEDKKASAREVDRVVSPSGCCDAYVVESSIEGVGENTLVVVSFGHESCGAGVVSSEGAGLGLEFSWIAEDILAVGYPCGATLRRNASGEYVKCGGRVVQVVLKALD